MVPQEVIDCQLELEMESVKIGIAKYREALTKARTYGGVEAMPPEAKAIRLPAVSGRRAGKGRFA
jgi:hypothetical protein